MDGTLDDVIDAICSNGWGGISIWKNGSKYMGCLLTKNYEPDHSTNCWNWQDSPTDVANKLLAYTEQVNGLDKEARP